MATARIPQPGFLSQDSTARIPQTGLHSKVSTARIPKPGFHSHDYTAMTTQLFHSHDCNSTRHTCLGLLDLPGSISPAWVYKSSVGL